MNYFSSADILVPTHCDLQKWAVIACDQYTSQPEYWKDVRSFVGSCPSTLHTFFPEAELADIKKEDYLSYSQNMCDYLQSGVLKEYPDSFIYVERTLYNGDVRQGILGVVDLEYYDYDPKPDTKIFATEATVLQRVPPRVALRGYAPLEFSHTVIFCDDPTRTIIEGIAAQKDQMQKLYDFDLMFGGGRVCGYLLEKEMAQCLRMRLDDYEKEHPYLVGDGNHSLVTAKLSYEAMKRETPDADFSNHPARFAMVELENIHQDAMDFEPIYRIAVCPESQTLIEDFSQMDEAGGVPVVWICGEKEGTVHLHTDKDELPIEALQRFLDHWVDTNPGTIDYIHGADAVRTLAQQPNTVGFLLPDLDKGILFPYILSGRVMPRKSFSIGQACEKRYYLEGRKIK